ncbi:MAG: Na/Pi cotransporter family protein [Tissierellia bacterium]|nr:Na/Pi cotransporter family protein [Tissierellia bacterium]
MKVAMQAILGLGLFIYGMTLMGEGLQKAAGKKLKAIVGALTKSTFRGVLVGAFVTMLIQSSGATTVMVIGFVNAKIMTLTQAVGVIMGANIGTTATGFIIALNLGQYAPLVIGIGTVFYVIGKKRSAKSIGQAILGFGLIFLGIMTMEQGLKPLGTNPIFTKFMADLSSPILGLIVGVVATTALQSSSAAIGIMQALGMQGLISLGAAFPILLGTNIGSTTTAVLSSFGAQKTAKRAALVHFLFNLIGSLIFLLLFSLFKGTFIPFMTSHFTYLPTQIAMSHLGFNLINTAIFLPFTKVLVRITETLIPGGEDDEAVSIYLDERILTTPAIALGQAVKETERMAEMVSLSLDEAEDLILLEKFSVYDSLMDRERLINRMEREITDYLVKLSQASLSQTEHKDVDDLLYVINDIERIGDHIKNIVELSEDMEEEQIKIPEQGIEELREMFTKCKEAFHKAVDAFLLNDMELANEVVSIEDMVDIMEEEYRANHIRRLANKYCDAPPGIIFLDCISNLERVSDHSDNIAHYVLRRNALED